MTSAPAAPVALSAEDLETVTYRLKFFEDDEFFPLPARTMRAILAALAAPAHAAVGAIPERLRRYVKVRNTVKMLGTDDVIHAVHTGTEHAAALCLSDLNTLLSASRPSRDDAGQAVALAARDAAETEADKRYDGTGPGSNAAWGAFQAGAKWQREQNAHPPAAGRVGELEAALREIADAHLPDQPSAHGGSEYDWAVRHIRRLRGIAQAALSGGAS